MPAITRVEQALTTETSRGVRTLDYEGIAISYGSVEAANTLAEKSEKKMRRPRPKQRRHQHWKSNNVMKRRRRAVRIAHRRAAGRRGRRPVSGTLIAPSHFAILSTKGSQSGSDVCAYFDFLAKLRNFKKGNLVIDFTLVRRMVADATLLFKAELSTLLQTKPVTVSAIAPRSNRTLQVLKQTGLDAILRIPNSVEPQREDVVHWRVAEGPRNHVDPNLLESIMDDIEKVTGLASHPIYQGIIESMGNCVEHAYQSHPEVTRILPTSPGWWVFQQVKDDMLSVNVCDLGIGVNRALPLTLAQEEGLLKKLLHISRKVKGLDNRALLAAMEYGRTRTGKTERGKGMRNAHAVVDDMGSGFFYAISNQGYYSYKKPDPDTPGKKHTIKLKYSINGTIMGWRLPLKPDASRSSS